MPWILGEFEPALANRLKVPVHTRDGQGLAFHACDAGPGAALSNVRQPLSIAEDLVQVTDRTAIRIALVGKLWAVGYAVLDLLFDFGGLIAQQNGVSIRL